MRKMITFFIAAFILIAVGLIITLVFAVRNGGIGFSVFSTNSFNMKLVNTQNISLAAIDSIDISYRSEDISFYTSDTNELVLKEFMNYTPNESELARINTNGNELSIKTGRELIHFTFWPFNHNCRVEVYLPAGYTGKLSAETSSGNIKAEPVLKLSEFNVRCSSGNINVEEVYSDSISAETSSGNITFQVAEGNRHFKVTSGNIRVMGGAGDSEFSASSGNITVEGASGHMEAKVSSGEIKFINSAGGGTFHTSSGNIALELTALTESLNVTASSGNIKLSLPSTAAFNFEGETSSGDIHTFFDDMLSYNKRGNKASGTVGENPGLDIYLGATSGNIRVSE